MLCSKLDCQKGFNIILFSYNIRSSRCTWGFETKLFSIGTHTCAFEIKISGTQMCGFETKISRADSKPKNLASAQIRSRVPLGVHAREQRPLRWTSVLAPTL